MPIYVGLQAPRVNQRGLATTGASQASAQGAASADDAGSRAKFVGLGSGAPIHTTGRPATLQFLAAYRTVMTFISAWTGELHPSRIHIGRLRQLRGAGGGHVSVAGVMSGSTRGWGGQRPVFVDMSGRRQRRLHMAGALGVLLAVGYVCVLFSTVLFSTVLGGPTTHSLLLSLPPARPHATVGSVHPKPASTTSMTSASRQPSVVGVALTVPAAMPTSSPTAGSALTSGPTSATPGAYVTASPAASAAASAAASPTTSPAASARAAVSARAASKLRSMPTPTSRPTKR